MSSAANETFCSRTARFGAIANGALYGFLAGLAPAIALGLVGVPSPVPFATLVIVAAAAMPYLVYRATRCAFEVGAQGVAVRGAYFSREIAWEEMEAIGWVVGDVPPYATVFAPTGRQLAIRPKGDNVSVVGAVATHSLGESERARLVRAVTAHAEPHAVPVRVTADELRSKWGVDSGQSAANPPLDG
jgi:hypothetical protein